VLTIAGVAVWALARRRLQEAAFAAGLLLYIAYITRIGGDFMSGRFLAAPFFMAVLFLVHQRVAGRVSLRTAAVAAAVIVILLTPRTNFSGGHFGEGNQLQYIAASGISDERGFYYQWTGLLRVLAGQRVEDTPWAREGRALAAAGPGVVPSRSVGIVGYYAGPAVHVVDIYALCDPLLARLPSTDAWRIGHFERRLPDGYLETLATGHNVIQDPGLAELHRRLVVVTRDPLWTRDRIQTAVALNFEGYDKLVAPWRRTARIPQPIQALGSLR
jgi:arabinofuranosyltransferase